MPISLEIVFICSDSKRAQQALDAYTTRSKLVVTSYQALNNLAKKRNVSLLWIPSHFGIVGNEIADSLAKRNSSYTLVGLEPDISICNSLIDQRIQR